MSMSERKRESERSILLCRSAWVGAVLLALAGRIAASPASAPTAVYRPTGTLAYMTLQPDGTGRHVVVAEWAGIHRWPPESLEKRPLRFVGIDLETGDSRTMGEVDRSPFLTWFEHHVSVTGTGRIAFVDPSGNPYLVHVIEPDGQGHVVKKEEADFVYGPAWRPDSTHLLLFAFNLPEDGVQTGGARLLDVPRDGMTSEEALPGVSGWSATWSSDGSAIYSLWPTGQATARIEALRWPSLTRSVMGTATIPYVNDYYPIARLFIAEDSGDLIWLSPSGTESTDAEFQVWRRPPGGEPKATSLRLSALPREVAVAPDGMRLALVRSDGRLVLGNLGTGAKALLPELPSRLEGRPWLSWAQEGRALVAASSEGGAVWLVPILSSPGAPE